MCDNTNNNNKDNLIDGSSIGEEVALELASAARQSITTMNPLGGASRNVTGMFEVITTGDTSNTMNDDNIRTSSGDLADKFSSSLASIAATTAGNNEFIARSDVFKRVRRTETIMLSEGGCGCGEEGELSSSSQSGGQTSGNGERGANVVTTGTATTSSGDDPDSSARNSGTCSNNNNNLSSGDDRFYAENERASQKQQPRGGSQLLETADSSSTTLEVGGVQRHHFHHHHHHHYRQRKRPQAKLSSAAASDDYGLPVPRLDDRFQGAASSSIATTTSTKHATVVAHHLPPPTTTNTDPAAATSNSGGGGQADERKSSSLLIQPLREPGFNTIRKLVRRSDTTKSSETDSSSSNDQPMVPHKKKKGTSIHSYLKMPATFSSVSIMMKDTLKRKRQQHDERGDYDDGGDCSSDDNAGGTNGGGSSSSGSGTEGGYAASASSNEIHHHHRVTRGAGGGAASNSSSPSVSSSEDGNMTSKRKRFSKTTTTLTHHAWGGGEQQASTSLRPLLSKKQESNLSMSSEIADFSSGACDSEVAETMKALREENMSAGDESPSITSSSNGDGSSDEQEEETTRHRPPAVAAVQKRAERALLQASTEARIRHAAATVRSHPPLSSLQVPTSAKETQLLQPRRKTGYNSSNDATPRGRLKTDDSSGPILQGKPPILAVGCDIMAHVLTFLEPPDILNVLTMPLSKDWLTTFTRQPELWRVLCLVEPFKAPMDEENSDDSGDDSFTSFPMKATSSRAADRGFGKFRMLYTSFVRCMRYLERIKDDAQNGRPPSIIDFGAANDVTSNCNIGANHNLQNFLARARGVVIRNNNEHDRPGAAGGSLTDSSSDDDNNSSSNEVAAVARLAPAHPIGVSDDDSSSHLPRKKRRRGCGKDTMMATKEQGGTKKIKYGRSMITDRLLLPAQGGEAGNPELPWSCAVYSIVNWMVAFADVEGIQTMCLKVLPFLLEDEQQRITAQRAGLTDVVLRGMVMFPDSAALHTASFHTIVLLARPLGGREGMLFHTSMVNSSGIFSSGAGGSQSGKNGIAVMLDSMRRFQQNELLQAMSCWSLVNIALVPAQKEVLVKLGGIAATANAMMAHAHNAEVQFRALFALINLVIPSVSLNPGDDDEAPQLAVPDDSTERELLDESVEQIASLVVQAMKNFCSSEAILNRACLVLHNLSLTPEYHSVLLWTPNAYQMLEWCLTNYRTDQVLQQSAAGTLHRLQIYLSSDESLRARFAASIHAQQQQSLELAHREAVILHQQHEQRLREEEQRHQASVAAAAQQPGN